MSRKYVHHLREYLHLQGRLQFGERQAEYCDVPVVRQFYLTENKKIRAEMRKIKESAEKDNLRIEVPEHLPENLEAWLQQQTHKIGYKTQSL